MNLLALRFSKLSAFWIIIELRLIEIFTGSMNY